MSIMPLVRGAAFRFMLRPAAVMTSVGSVGSYGSEMHDLRGKLPIHSTKVYPTRDISEVKGIVFHHTATRSQTLKSISDFHVNGRGWPAIAYHIAIGYDGKVYLLHDLTTASYHTAGRNRGNIGIALVGNYQDREMTPEMKASVLMVLEWIESDINIQHIWLHRDAGKTECPGRYAIEYLEPLQFGPKP
jgi:hypothetical protein